MDVVEYSTLLITDQTRVMRELTRIDQRLGNSFRQIFHARIVARVFEWQNSDGQTANLWHIRAFPKLRA